jgi:hypothetical protein
MAVLGGTAKFREETSKKADSTVKDRIAATHKLRARPFVSKQLFALHQATVLRAPQQPTAKASRLP